jgi:hypothetical protein
MKIKHSFGYLVILLLFYGSYNVYGQEHQEGHEDQEKHEQEEGRHLFLIGFGWTYIPEGGDLESTEAKGFLVPTIGIDYLYKVSERWEVGLMTDFELDHYLIVDKELERENAFIATGVGLYHLSHRLSVFAGAGIEVESHKNLAIFRAGFDSPFHLKKGWVFTPSITFDFKEDYNTWSLKFYLGKEF